MEAENQSPENLVDLADKYALRKELNHRWTTSEM
jgi:hypothetical protein